MSDGFKTSEVYPAMILTRLAAAYVIFITLWFLARLLFFDQFWPLALLNTIAEYLFVPLPILLIGTIWQRRWSGLLLLGVPAVVLIGLFGELFWLPSASHGEDNSSPITAMSFNILYSNMAYEAIANSIHATSPDLVGLQELTSESAQALATALATEYPYNTLQSLGPGRGAGLLSRFPIETAEWFSLPPLDIALHAVVNIKGERVHVFVVHLSPNNFFSRPLTEFIPLVIERYGRRAAEVTRLEEEIAHLEEPILLMCDCNLTDTSEAYTHLAAFLEDSFRERGWGLGHTLYPPQAPFPVQRIDYIWHSPDFVATHAYVGQAGSSDHLPIVAELSLIKRGHE